MAGENSEPNGVELKELLEKVGTPPIDPTANVLKLVEEAVRRLDDLARLQAESMRREMDLRSTHQRELAAAEKERLDAIRAIDAQSINLASNAVSSVQQAMDAKINLVAERSQQQLQGTTTLLQERLLSIERNQYLGAGAKEQQHEGRAQNQWAVGIGLGVLGAGAAIAGVAVALAGA